MKKFSLSWMSLALAVAFLAPTRAELPPLPDNAIDDTVFLLLKADITQLSPASMQEAVFAIIDTFPESLAAEKEPMKASVIENMAEAQELHGKLLAAGAKTLLIGIGQGGPDDKVLMFLHTEPGTTPETVNAIRVGEPEEGNEPPTFATFANGWLVATGEDFRAPEGSFAQQSEWQSSFSEVEQGPLQMVLLINDEMREQMKAGMAENPMLAGLIQPLQASQRTGIVTRLGAQPEVRVSVDFADATSAKTFTDTMNGLLTFGKGMLMGQLAQAPEAPSAAEVDALFAAVQLKESETRSTLAIDTNFVNAAGPFAELVMPMIMMQMMGAGPMEMDAETQLPDDFQVPADVPMESIQQPEPVTPE